MPAVKYLSPEEIEKSGAQAKVVGGEPQLDNFVGTKVSLILVETKMDPIKAAGYLQ